MIHSLPWITIILVTCEVICQWFSLVTSLGTKKSSFTVTHALFFMSTPPSSTPDDESEWNCFCVYWCSPQHHVYVKLRNDSNHGIFYTVYWIPALTCRMSNATWRAPELFIVTTGLFMWLPLFAIVSTMTTRRTTTTSRWTTTTTRRTWPLNCTHNNWFRLWHYLGLALSGLSCTKNVNKFGSNQTWLTQTRFLRHWSLTLSTTSSQIILFFWSPNSPWFSNRWPNCLLSHPGPCPCTRTGFVRI